MKFKKSKIKTGGVMKTLTKMVILFCWSICLVFSADNTEEKLRLEQERLQQKQTELNQQTNGEFEKVVPGKHFPSDRIPIGIESGKSKEDVIPASAQSERHSELLGSFVLSRRES